MEVDGGGVSTVGGARVVAVAAARFELSSCSASDDAIAMLPVSRRFLRVGEERREDAFAGEAGVESVWQLRAAISGATVWSTSGTALSAAALP